MTLDSAKEFRKLIAFWFGSSLVVGIFLFYKGVSPAPILLGGLVALAALLVKYFVRGRT